MRIRKWLLAAATAAVLACGPAESDPRQEVAPDTIWTERELTPGSADALAWICAVWNPPMTPADLQNERVVLEGLEIDCGTDDATTSARLRVAQIKESNDAK